MPHAHTEDQHVEQPAKAGGPPSPWSSPSGRGEDGLFAELCRAVAGPPPYDGVVGEPRDAVLLGRETKGEVVLVPRLRAALERLNPTLPSETIAAAELNWTPILDPYWTHAGLMIDPSAGHSA